MADGSRRSRPHVVLAVLAGLGAGALSIGTASAEQPSAADIQWAQTILKEKHYDIGGRANGQLTPQTRAALSKYQKDHGLPVTGNLDTATIGKMMGERNAKPSGTMGNLAQQKIGGGGPGQEPRQTREVVPRAAHRSGDVDNVGGGEVTLGPVVRSAPAGLPTAPASPSHSVSSASPSPPASPSPSPSPSAAAPPRGEAPQAAPRGSVTATTTDGKVVPANVLSKAEDGFSVPGWLRYAVMSVLAGTLGYIGLGWWRSGRKPKPLPMRQEEPREMRREPSFGVRRDELTTGPLPRLSGERRGR